MNQVNAASQPHLFDRPIFSIDIPPYKAENTGSIPKAVPGTFYDLLAPDVSGKQKKAYSYTYKALTDQFSRTLLEACMASMPLDQRNPEYLKSKLIDKEELDKLYQSSIPGLAQYVSLHREGNSWSIKLPIRAFTPGEFLESAIVKIPAESKYSFENRLAAASLAVIPSLKHKGFAFSTVGAPNFAVAKNQLANIASAYSKSQSFFFNYVKEYIVEPVYAKQMASTFAVQGQPVFDLEDLDTSTSGGQYTMATKIRDLAMTRYIAYAVVVLPDAEAAFYVQTPSDQIKPAQLLDFFYRWQLYAFRTQIELPTFTHSNTTIRNKNASFTPRPRTNKLGIVIDKNNSALYIPANVDRLYQYDQDYNTLAMDQTGAYSVHAVDQDTKLARSLTHKLLYVDWINNKVLYTAGTPNLQQPLELETTYTAPAATTLGYLSADFNDYLANFSNVSYNATNLLNVSNLLSSYADTSLIPNLINALQSVNVRVANKTAYALRPDIDMFSYIALVNEIMTGLNDTFKDSTSETAPAWAFNYPIKNRDIVESSPNPFLRPIAKYLSVLHDAIMADPVKYINGIQQFVPNTLGEIALLILANQAKDVASWAEQDNNERGVYFNQRKLDPNFQPAFKHSGGVSGFMPHQAKVLNITRDIPKFAIIAVAAGGGKTILTITDILRAILADRENEGAGIKKPLVLCPTNLIKDYVAEVNYVSKGTVNAIAFDTGVYRRFATTEETHLTGVFNYTKLRNLVDNAPANTIFIAGYQTTERAGDAISVYGNSLLHSNQHIEFLRSCHFDGVWMDESHYLKSPRSSRVRSIEQLVAEIPYKRLLSGTISPNTLVDLVRQVGLLSPSILGSERNFRKRYDKEGRETGVFLAKPGAEAEIASAIRASCVYVNVQRKEWAAKLPRLREFFASEELTENQWKVYNALIGELLDEMEKDPEAKKVLDSNKTEDADDEDDEMENLFRKYEKNLAAVEAFLAAPMSNPLAAEFLTEPNDKLSPKGRAVVQIVQKHLDDPQQYPGKILVFCNTHAAVEGIFNAMPEDMQARTLVYNAAKKADHEARFKNDNNVRVLVGVSQSLETGLNLQIADTLIRVDNVWSPGTFEQGMSRINRPNIKAGVDPRMATGIFCYYIMIDRTIDVLKTARLTSKTVQVTKFYNAGTEDEHYYAGIGLDHEGQPIEPIRISFENLRNGLSVATDLAPYHRAYSELRTAEQSVFEDYRTKNPVLVDVPNQDLGLFEDAKFLRNVPYVTGMSIYNADELGLVPWNDYKRKQLETTGAFDPVGLNVHTAIGDGVAYAETISTVKFELNDIKFSQQQGLVFVITKAVDSTQEVRERLAELTGLEMLDLELEPRRLARKQEKLALRQDKIAQRDQKRELQQKQRLERQIQQVKKQEQRLQGKEKVDPRIAVRQDKLKKELKQKQQDMIAPWDEEANKEIQLYVSLVNDTIALATSTDDPDASYKELKQYGFKPVPAYLYTQVKRADTLEQLIEKLDDLSSKDIVNLRDKEFNLLHDILAEFKQGKNKLLQVEQKPQTEIINFLRDRFKKPSDTKLVRPVPMIVEGELYVCFDITTTGAPAISAVRKIKLPNVTWNTENDTLVALFDSKMDLAAVLRRIEDDGYTIANRDEVKAAYAAIKFRGKR